jgi:hypothetical protein
MSKEYFFKVVPSNLFQFKIIRVFEFSLCVCFLLAAQGVYSGLKSHPRYGDIPDGDLQQSALEAWSLELEAQTNRITETKLPRYR